MKKKLILISVYFITGISEWSDPGVAFCADSSYLLSSSLKMIWGLMIVLGILLIIYGIAKKKLSFVNAVGKGSIKIIETRHIMPKKTLFLIEVKGREYLLGAGSDSIQLITPIDPVTSPSSFDDLLQETEQQASL